MACVRVHWCPGQADVKRRWFCLEISVL